MRVVGGWCTRVEAALAGLRDDQPISDAEAQVMEVVRGHFRPEFLNRLDEIVLFQRLGESAMAPIVDLQVKRVQDLLAEYVVPTTRELEDDAVKRTRVWTLSANR